MPDGQRVVALVAGEADLESAPRLHEGLVACLAYRPRSLIVDATDLSFCDGHGLAALVKAVAVAKRSGVRVTVRPSPQLAWLVTTVQQALPTSGQPGHDLLGCPLPPRPTGG
jgi:anti-sigma B factor antagonist